MWEDSQNSRSPRSHNKQKELKNNSVFIHREGNSLLKDKNVRK